jgi:MFS family permease
MGVMASTSAVGTALGPVIGGFLLDVAGWRTMFLALVPTGAAALFLLRRHLANERPELRAGKASFDLTGALLLALTLVCYELAMTMGRASFGAGNLALLLLSILGAALFVAVEARASAPLVQLARLRDGVVGTALLANVAVSFVMMSTLVIGPFHLSQVFGLGPAQVGLAMALGPSLVAILGVPAGHAADRLGGERASLAGLAIIVAGSVAMVVAAADYGIAGYLIPVAVITIGYAMFQASNNMVVMTRVAHEESGAMSGMLNLSRNLGLISGASVMAAIFAGAAGTDNLAPAAGESIAAATRTSFAVAAALVGAIFVLVASRRRCRPVLAAGAPQAAFP